MSAAEEFLETAAALTALSGPGTGHFRRSISTSYYAVFHCVVEACVDTLFVSNVAREDTRKWFEHGALADVAKAVRDAPSDQNKLVKWIQDGSAGTGLVLPPSPELRKFAENFRALYEQRQVADYFSAPALTLGKGDAMRSLNNANAVCTQVASWVAESDRSFERVAFAMLSRSVKARPR
jgi:hypothetical protein